MVVRDSGPCIAAGPIAWPPYGPVADQFVWHPELAAPLSPNGIAHPIALVPEIETTELDRFARRYPPLPAWSPRIAAGLGIIHGHLATPSPPTAKIILNSALCGVARRCDPNYVAFDPDNLGEQEANEAFQIAIHALAALITFDGMSWQGEDNCEGQLRRARDNTNILIWRDATRNSREIKRLLGQWMLFPGEHPRLLIIGEGFRSQLDEGLLSGDRRDNVAEAPDNNEELGAAGSLAATHEDVTSSRSHRLVACIRLERISNFYMNYSANDEATRLLALTEQLGRAFDSEGVA